jgi:hypothetical protein
MRIGLGALALSRKAVSNLVIVWLSALPRLFLSSYGTTRFTPDGFSLNFIFEYFWKIYRDHLDLIKICQE